MLNQNRDTLWEKANNEQERWALTLSNWTKRKAKIYKRRSYRFSWFKREFARSLSTDTTVDATSSFFEWKKNKKILSRYLLTYVFTCDDEHYRYILVHVGNRYTYIYYSKLYIRIIMCTYLRNLIRCVHCTYVRCCTHYFANRTHVFKKLPNRDLKIKLFMANWPAFDRHSITHRPITSKVNNASQQCSSQNTTTSTYEY